LLTEFLHLLVANPWVYDQVQVMAGARRINRHLIAQFGPLSSVPLVLELGGGTGRIRNLWPRSTTYICLDTDEQKLRRFLHVHTDGAALLADATLIPIRSSSVDVVVCVAVSHHIPDKLLANLVDESRRVLTGNGTLIFMDAIWSPKRWAGRLLWRYDRGAYPRSAGTLHTILSAHFKNVHRERFAFWHEYLLWIGTPQLPEAGPPRPARRSLAGIKRP
jgi:SAM-dependent methyltransferase